MENIEGFTKMKWNIKKIKKIDNKNLTIIEGLPGMGNVGKIALDFMVDNLKAEKVLEIYSHSFPHCVFVEENNMIELPMIRFYQKKIKDKTILLIGGDIQPLDEQSCYEFCDLVLDIAQEHKVKEIITLGGIGLQQIPKEPKVFISGNDKNLIRKYTSKSTDKNIHGVVGPIIGVSGLLLGLAQQRNIPAITLLAETFGHPTFLGIAGSHEILKVLDEKLNLKLDLKSLNKEVKNFETEIKKADNLTKIIQKSRIRKKSSEEGDISYIG